MLFLKFVSNNILDCLTIVVSVFLILEWILSHVPFDLSFSQVYNRFYEAGFIFTGGSFNETQ